MDERYNDNNKACDSKVDINFKYLLTVIFLKLV